MSNKALDCCWSLPMAGPRKLVLIYLADHANKEHQAWPSLARAAAETGLGERSVRRALRWLEDHGAISVTHRTGRNSLYALTPEQFTPAGAAGADPPAAPAQAPEVADADAPPAHIGALAELLRHHGGLKLALTPTGSQATALGKLLGTGASVGEIRHACAQVAASGVVPTSPAYYVPVIERLREGKKEGRPAGINGRPRNASSQQPGSIAHEGLAAKDYEGAATPRHAVDALFEHLHSDGE